MGLTLRAFMPKYNKTRAYPHKCKRKHNKRTARKTIRSLRNINRFADELHFTSFRERKHIKSHVDLREIFCENRVLRYEPKMKRSGQLVGNKYNANLMLKDLFTGETAHHTEKQKIVDHIRRLTRQGDEQCPVNNQLSRSSSRKISDLYVVAYKQIKRRGKIGVFKGHRQLGELYKRELLP